MSYSRLPLPEHLCSSWHDRNDGELVYRTLAVVSMGFSYRIRQLLNLVNVKPLPMSAWKDIESILSPQELSLFRKQVTSDRTHSYRVLLTLREVGEDDERLLKAALLHDVGKSRIKTTILDRVIGVVGETLFPERTAKWGKSERGRWARPYLIRRQHAQWGADLAEQAGSSETTVRLIRHHQAALDTIDDRGERQLLERLQWADNQN